MNLGAYLETSKKYTEKASDIARQFNFAGIGIIWIIISTNNNLGTNNPSIISPLITISTSLIIDFLQYVLGGLLWRQYYHEKNKEVEEKYKSLDKKALLDKKKEEFEILEEDKWRRKLLYYFYYAKFILMFFSYFLILRMLLIYY